MRSPRATAAAIVVSIAAALLLAVQAAPAVGSPTIKISSDIGGGDADGVSDDAAVNADGSAVAYESDATNNAVVMSMAQGGATEALDRNGARDVFVHSVYTGATVLVSSTPAGMPGNGPSWGASMSADGRFVAFTSSANDLVSHDRNPGADVFVRDLATGATELASVGPDGMQVAGESRDGVISGDGRLVAFVARAGAFGSPFTHVLLRDRAARTTTMLSQIDGVAGDGDSDSPAISDAGVVAFRSDASTLTKDLNGTSDVFVWAGGLHRVSEPAGGGESDGPSSQPSLSPDGATVAFTSEATNLDGAPDDNGAADVFVGPVAGGLPLRRGSLGSRGEVLDGPSGDPSLASGGRLVFSTRAANAIPGVGGAERKIIVRDLTTGANRLASAGSDGGAAAGESGAPAISADGRTVVFSSDAPNLVSGDGNGLRDVFANIDEQRCPSGPPDHGAISGPVHDVAEPVADPVGRPARAIHPAACRLAAAGL